MVQSELASGGMGIVYRVLDRTTGEARALKRIKPDAAGQRVLIEAFEREYQVLAGLDHPRIIRVFDYGVDDVGPYYTMELLEGEDMRRSAPLPYREACLYLRDIATSLSLLHARKLLHRDLSPTNVRKSAEGHCKLIDFGALAPFGYSRLVVGTAPAIPPEALGSSQLDQRADLYSLGALAYFMLTGRHAYPAKRIEELHEYWQTNPAPPSELVADIPAELDILVMSLLSADPLARPASAAEVIAKLAVVGELPPDEEGDADRLAQSFLLSPAFVGRADHLAELTRLMEGTVSDHGAAIRVEAAAGMGRTRLLDEIGVRAQIAGARVLRVDASMYRQAHGTARALVMRAWEAFPEAARELGPRHAHGLASLGREIEALVPRRSTLPSRPADATADPGGPLEWFFAELGRRTPLVVAVDNVEDADAASLGLLAGLAKISGESPVLAVFTERLRRGARLPLPLLTLRGQCKTLSLTGLSPDETGQLVRSLFGDAPNAARFADWVHGTTAGSPLHVVEISRRLVAKEIVRYFGGMWVLPVERPDAELPEALEDALSIRIESLGPEARRLAECLSLQREQPTLALCRLVASPADERQVLTLLDELARNDVLHADQDGYRFSSTALRESLLAGMTEERRQEHHAKLGEAFARLAGDTDPALRIEAGFHLIKGGNEVEGADLIAKVAANSVTVRTLIANLHLAGRPIESALRVYRRHRRSVYERMPLLAALAQAGYYEDRYWGEEYGDEALDVLDDMSGLRTARRLRPFMGRVLALVFGIVLAFARFQLVKKRERNYAFREVMVQLFGAVTTLTGVASICLDTQRAARVAEVLEPFSGLPARLTPVGIYQFCRGLQWIGQEHQHKTYTAFDELIRRFENPRYYPSLPAEARRLYWTGAHSARGSFAVMRADGKGALESAAALDASGLKLYAMIASQLRFFYHMNRGESVLAAAHREQVELHAAHVGSAWQVEVWEGPALLLVHTALSDIVASARVADRVERLARKIRSLAYYSKLAKLALSLSRREMTPDLRSAAKEELFSRAPRSFIGWAASIAFHARDLNDSRNHAEARESCEFVLRHLKDEDREYVSTFLLVEIEMARADAGLGQVDAGLARLDGLLARFSATDHPLVHGSLHEARARIGWAAGRRDLYDASLAEVVRWYRPTDNPALIAKLERLAELAGGLGTAVRVHHGATDQSSASAFRSSRSAASHATSQRSEHDSDRDRQTVRPQRRRQSA